MKTIASRPPRKASRTAVAAAAAAAPGNTAADAVRAIVRPNGSGPRSPRRPRRSASGGSRSPSPTCTRSFTRFHQGQVVDYYLRIADTILPHLRIAAHAETISERGRWVLLRKELPVHRPAWLNTANVPRRTARGNQLLPRQRCRPRVGRQHRRPGAAHFAGQTPGVERPTMMVFDLDPGPPADIVDAATSLSLRDLLAARLKSLAKHPAERAALLRPA